MSVLPDWMIERDVKITPFSPQQTRPGIITFGVTSYGYDMRVGRKFKVFTNVWGSTVDPKHFDPKSFVDVDADFCIIPPNSFALAETVEYMEIPRDVLGICVGKSTYARCGIIVNVTPLEPEWKGKVTVEISNTTPLPAKIYADEGIMQVIFIRSDGCHERLSDFWTAKIINGLELAWNEQDIKDEEEAIRNGMCRTSYADKKGKYQNQEGLTLPKVDQNKEETR